MEDSGLMRGMLVKNRGKYSKGNTFYYEGNTQSISFSLVKCNYRKTPRISLTGKKSKNTENFPGKGNTIYITYNISIFPDGQRGKERWALSVAHPPSFPCPLTNKNFQETILHIKSLEE